MTASARPVPVPDPQSAPYWEAAVQHVLVMARCSVCAAFTHPPDVVCQHCGSTAPDFKWVRVSGEGMIRSWTVVHRSFLAGFEDDLPYVLVDVELSEQRDLRTIGRLLDGPNTPIAVGDSVEVEFEDRGPGVSIPSFRLVGRR